MKRGLQICEACEWGCKDCKSNRKQCSECFGSADGWTGLSTIFLNNGVCNLMLDNCAQMDVSVNQFKCKVCNYGFRNVDGRCLQCVDTLAGYVHCPNQCSVTDPLWYSTVDKVGWQPKKPVPLDPKKVSA